MKDFDKDEEKERKKRENTKRVRQHFKKKLQQAMKCNNTIKSFSANQFSKIAILCLSEKLVRL